MLAPRRSHERIHSIVSRSTVTVRLTLTLSSSTVATGCGEDDNGGGGSLGTDGVDCVDCEDAVYVCSCKNPNDNDKWKPYYSECLDVPATSECEEYCDDLYGLEEPPAINARYENICDDAATAICGSYDPSAAIDLVSGIYEVDKDFIATLANDTAPLYVCDDAIVNFNSNIGRFVVSDASSGEFLYELGLRNGDVILSINGLSISSYFTAASAYLSLYVGGETDYELSFVRNLQTETNYYQLVE